MMGRAHIQHVRVDIGAAGEPATLTVRSPSGKVMTPTHQHLSRDVLRQLRGTKRAYFEAERIGPVFHLGDRLGDLGW